ncbi:MAG: NAD(P)H-dependent glycerol-3-phosphate dehydrogenase [Bacteriovoracaceae bacterium]
MSIKFNNVLVIGAGAFGTSIASVLANNFKNVVLKVRSDDVYESIKEGKNQIYLPGHELSGNIIGAKEWKEIDSEFGNDFDLIVSGLPTAGIKHFFSENQERFQKYLDRDIPFVSLSKGIDPVTLELSDDLFFDLFPDKKELFTFLSGPSFAKEIMEEQITLVTIAGRSRKILMKVRDMFECPYFKVFPNYDVKGTLLGGALKNILAIAGGIIEGLGFNHNTRAAMITRGIAEMLRFGKVYNARPETFYGLSGMGDLILTTTGGLSRNKTFGLELAKGRKPQEIIDSQRTVVEGYKTAKAAKLVCEKYEISARIFDAVYQVLYEDQNPKDVITKLMTVPSKFEID